MKTLKELRKGSPVGRHKQLNDKTFCPFIYCLQLLFPFPRVGTRYTEPHRLSTRSFSQCEELDSFPQRIECFKNIYSTHALKHDNLALTRIYTAHPRRQITKMILCSSSSDSAPVQHHQHTAHVAASAVLLRGISRLQSHSTLPPALSLSH